MASIFDIPPGEVGHRISVAEFDAIVAACKAQVGGKQGARTSTGTTVTTDTTRSKSKWSQVLPAVSIPAYSVFGLCSDATPELTDDTHVARVDKIGAENRGSHVCLYTNGPVALEADVLGWARPIGKYEVARLRYVGTKPPAGSMIGVDVDLFTVTGEDERYGLLVVASYDETPEGKFCDVVAVDHASGLLVKITEEVTGATPPDTLGRGRASVQFREADAETVVDAPNPADDEEAFELDVFNTGEATIPVDTILRAVYCVGVGFVVASNEEPEVQAGSVQLYSDPTTIWATHPGIIQFDQFEQTDSGEYFTIFDDAIDVDLATKNGVEILKDGTYALSVHIAVNASSAPDNNLYVPEGGDIDLCTKITLQGGEFYVTLDDNELDGSNGIGPVLVWSTLSACGYNGRAGDGFTIYTALAAGTKVRVWRRFDGYPSGPRPIGTYNVTMGLHIVKEHPIE